MVLNNSGDFYDAIGRVAFDPNGRANVKQNGCTIAGLTYEALVACDEWLRIQDTQVHESTLDLLADDKWTNWQLGNVTYDDRTVTIDMINAINYNTRDVFN